MFGQFLIYMKIVSLTIFYFNLQFTHKPDHLDPGSGNPSKCYFFIFFQRKSCLNELKFCEEPKILPGYPKPKLK